jgi:glycosyltransferase involved in cell wall biosynthesis
VSVVVPARDAEATIATLLDALAAQTVPPREIVVVDDASSDRTGDIAAAHPTRPVVRRADGAGSYAARNCGLAVVSSPLVAFTDADCLPEPDWLERGLAALAAPAQLVGGRIEQQRRHDAGICERYDRATYLDQAELIPQGFAATANLFADTAALRSLGAFDGSLRSSGDLELGLRARRAGLVLRYAPAAVVRHQPRSSPSGLWRLHRRLGAGWRQLARRGLAPVWWREPALRVPLGSVVDAVRRDGPALRRRHLAPVHALVLAARWRGRLLG